MSLNQLIRIQRAVKRARIEFLRQTESHIKTILTNYQQAQDDIEQQLLKRMDQPINSFTTQRLQELDLHIQRRIETLAPRRDNQILYALETAQESGFDTQMLQRRIMNRPALGIDWNSFTPRGVEYYQSYALQLCKTYDQELVTAIQTQLRLGLIEQKSWNQIITDIRRNAFGFKKYQRIDRKDRGATWKIKRMVRTETARMRSMAEEEVIRADTDIIGVSFYWGQGPCPNNSCPPLVGDYYKDGSGMGWPPPSLPIHPNCYSKDTEILTKCGFKKFSDITYSDEVATLNPENLNIEYYKPSNIIKYHYKGDLYYFRNRRLDLMVTPNHRLWVADLLRFNFKLVEAKDTKQVFRMARSSCWQGKDNMDYPCKGEITLEDFVFLLGLYIAEGCMKDGEETKQRIQIAAVVKKERIKQFLIKMPFVVAELGDRFIFSNKELCEYFKELGLAPNKHIPVDVKQLSAKYLKILLDGIALGDGNIEKPTKINGYNRIQRRRFYTCSKQLADDIQELLMKIGKVGSVRVRDRRRKVWIKDHWATRKQLSYEIAEMNKSNYAQVLKNKHLALMPYDDMVYCCEVPNHIIYVRRNGKVVWSGNCMCYTTNIYPEIKDYVARLKEAEYAL